MLDFVSLTCPSCGGRLKITNEIDRFACIFCGVEQIVKRGDGVIFLSPVVEEIKAVKDSVDKTASELALRRLTDERQKNRGRYSIFIDRLNVWGFGWVFAGVRDLTIPETSVPSLIQKAITAEKKKLFKRDYVIKEFEEDLGMCQEYASKIYEINKEIEYHTRVIKNM